MPLCAPEIPWRLPYVRKTTLFRKLVLDENILVLPGSYDALSARIIEQTGFKATVIGGYASSASLLAKPDAGLLTLTEMAERTRYVVDAVDIPVFVDGDTGHGNVTNVIRTVREFERAGAAGLFIEDQVFPKRCGHMEGKGVIGPGEMIAKIKAATDARVDPDLVIMARTDALAVSGIDDAIERAVRYRQAGADLIFVEAPSSEDDLARIAREVTGPTFASMIEGGKTPILTPGRLQALGFSVVAYGLSTLYAASWAMKAAMEELHRTGTTSGMRDKMIAFDEFNALVGLGRLRATEGQYPEEIPEE
jgi:2,3-dimethylmalate lyase